jgi:hypothetical protein
MLGVRIYTGVEFVSVDTDPADGWYGIVTKVTDPNGFNERCPKRIEAGDTRWHVVTR